MAEIKKFLGIDALGTLVDQVKAEDAKALQAAKDYSDSLATNYDGAGSAATAEANAKAHAEAKVKELADGQVKTNTDAIAKLNGDATTEGSVAKAVADAQTTLQGNIDAVDAIADANTEAIAAINNAETGILAQAKADAKDKADAVQANVDALAEKVGEVPEGETIVGMIEAAQDEATYDDTEVRGLISALDTNKADKTQVATDIAAAVKVETDARVEAVKGVQDAVDALAGTHATDKKALEDAIALKADQTALDAVSAVANAAVKQSDYDTKVAALDAEDARIAGLVATEKERAEGVEAGLEERLVEVETFFKTAEGETLDTALDTLVEIQTYITGEGAAADQMVLDIAANKKAIEDHVATDHDFAAADATLKSELEGQIALKADKTTVEGIDGRVETLEGEMDTVEGKVSTLEGEMDAVEAAVATKVEQEAYNTKVAALEGADSAQVERIAALEAKFGEGEGSVADQIADAKQEAIDAAASAADTKDAEILKQAKAYADEEDAKIEVRVDALETASATHALASDLTALAGRVETAEGEIDTLQSEMDAVEALAAANKAAHEANAAAIALKAAQADLDAAVARVAQNETDIDALQAASATHALASDLTAAVERIAANETAIAANTSAINSFTAITSDEVNALFA